MWDYTKTEYEKQAAANPKWHLERLLLYGMNGEKLDRELLTRYLAELKIPDNTRAFLELLLWGKQF